MSEKNNKYTPNLRFPEFSGEWEEKKLGEFFHLQNGYAFRSDAYIADGKYKIVTIANVQSGKLDLIKTNSLNQLPSNIANHQKLNIGDIILSMTGNVGRVCMVDQDNCLLNQRVGLLKQTNENIDRRYVYSLINSKQFETAMVKSGQGAAQANISKEDVDSYSFWVPPTLAEQDKIASCLSAMDDLIAAQAEKVEALKEKKTGLMQQLFPQPGETTPRLRFPEFSGEWEEKKLGELLTYEQPTPYLVTDTNYKKSGIPVLTAGKTFILGYTDETHGVYDNLPVIIFDDFVTESKFVDFPFKVKSSAMKMLKLLDENNNLHLIYELMQLLQYPVKEHKRYWISEYSRLTIPLPPSPAEQEKIAFCLSALDDQIAAETKKLTALKDYKKGLMQQLFPQPAK